MTQQNPILTLSKCQAATNVLPLEHESSPKNDISYFSGALSPVRRKIYEEGFEAYLTGKTNPYSGSGKKYWESGWHDAMRKDDEALEIESINAHNAMMDESVDFDH